MLVYILSKVPASFCGKDNYLSVKISPHTPICYINEISSDGVKTSEGFYEWHQCPKTVVATIYQRLKLIEYNERNQRKDN